MKEFISSTVCKFDAHSKKIRDEFGPVDRVLVYNNNLLATNQKLCDVCEYSGGIENTFFRFSCDSGGDFLKVNGTIESLVDDLDPSEPKQA